jgi:hypothetical protein
VTLGTTARDSILNIIGGEVGRNFIAFSGNQINISGGVIKSGFTLHEDGNELNITGGVFEGGIRVGAGNMADISGGMVQGLYAETGGAVHLRGGHVALGVEVDEGGSFHYSGGGVQRSFQIGPNSSLNVNAQAFFLDGIPIPGLNVPGDSIPFNLPNGSRLTILFPDGIARAFEQARGDSIADGTLTLSRVTPGTETYIFNVPTDSAPTGIGMGHTLNLQDGGALGYNFYAYGADVSILGGTVGENFLADGGTTVNISGGTVHSGLSATHASTINVTGGTIWSDVSLHEASTLNLDGSVTIPSVNVHSQSRVNVYDGFLGIDEIDPGADIHIYGGEVFIGDLPEDSLTSITGGLIGDENRGLVALAGSTVNIKGGSYRTLFGEAGLIFADNTIKAFPDSSINLFGSSFILDGVDLTAGLNPGEPITISDRDVLLRGALADGSPFSFFLRSLNNATPNLGIGSLYAGGHYIDPDATLTIMLISAGDVNLDGFVGIEDLNIILSHWNQTGNPGQPIAGDINADGIVGIEDLNVVLGNWNVGTPPSLDLISIPEPGTLGLGGLGVIGAYYRSRGDRKPAFRPRPEQSA